MVSILLIIFVSLLIFLAWMRIKIGKNNDFFNPAIFVTSFISIWLFIWVILLINEIGIGHAIDKLQCMKKRMQQSKKRLMSL